MVRETAIGICVMALLLAAARVSGEPKAQGSDNYDELYARYLTSARTTGAAAGSEAPRSVAWMAGLALLFPALGGSILRRLSSDLRDAL